MTPYTFFITPIDRMTPIWKMPDRKNTTRLHPIDIKKAAETAAKKKADKEKLAKERAEKKDGKVYGDELIARAMEAVKADKEKAEKDKQAKEENKPAEKVADKAGPKTVMYFAGFNQASLNFLQQQLDP